MVLYIKTIYLKDDSVLLKMIMVVINIHGRDVHATNNDDEGWIVVYVEILGNDYIESDIDVKRNDNNVDKSTIDHCKCLKEIDEYPKGCIGLLDVKVVTIHAWTCMTNNSLIVFVFWLRISIVSHIWFMTSREQCNILNIIWINHHYLTWRLPYPFNGVSFGTYQGSMWHYRFSFRHINYLFFEFIKCEIRSKGIKLRSPRLFWHE